jgi:hypothetical protein
MSQPHLILHKVRGAPAFDVAEPFTTEDGEEMWIVSTSGHRAYPYYNIEVAQLGECIGFEFEQLDVPDMPDPWPDHYPCNDRSTLATATLSLLQSIGLGPKALKRRKVK